jgi:peptide/nickel transport system permease protein
MMWIYCLKRILATIPILLGLTLIVFLIMAMIPGDPAQALLGPWATPENVTRVKAELGLDKPLYQQYFIWMHNLISGDFGRSFVLNRPVVDEVLERFSATLILGGCALLLSSLLGLLAGIFSAIRQFSWSDRTLTLAVLLGISMPSLDWAIDDYGVLRSAPVVSCLGCTTFGKAVVSATYCITLFYL